MLAIVLLLWWVLVENAQNHLQAHNWNLCLIWAATGSLKNQTFSCFHEFRSNTFEIVVWKVCYTLCSAHKTRNYFVGFPGRSRRRSERFGKRELELHTFHFTSMAVLHEVQKPCTGFSQVFWNCGMWEAVALPWKEVAVFAALLLTAAVNSSWYETRTKTKW